MPYSFAPSSALTIRSDDYENIWTSSIDFHLHICNEGPYIPHTQSSKSKHFLWKKAQPHPPEHHRVQNHGTQHPPDPRSTGAQVPISRYPGDITHHQGSKAARARRESYTKLHTPQPKTTQSVGPHPQSSFCGHITHNRANAYIYTSITTRAEDSCGYSGRPQTPAAYCTLLPVAFSSLQ